MKKILLLSFLVLTSFCGYAQKIRINEVDKFNGNRMMETTGSATVSNFEAVHGYIYFKAVNNTPILHYAYSRGVDIRVFKTAKLLLLDDQDNVYTFTCYAKGYNDEFPFIGDYEQLLGKNIIQIRFESGANQLDQKVKKSHYQAFSQQYLCIKNAILQYYPKGVLLSTDEGVKEIME